METTSTQPAPPPAADRPEPPRPASDPRAETPAPQPALPLEYANPWPQWAAPSPLATAVFWLGVRRVVVAGGVGLLAWAFVSLAFGVNRHAAPVAAGWGIAFVVLMLPLRLGLPRSEPPRQAPRKTSR